MGVGKDSAIFENLLLQKMSLESSLEDSDVEVVFG